MKYLVVNKTCSRGRLGEKNYSLGLARVKEEPDGAGSSGGIEPTVDARLVLVGHDLGADVDDIIEIG